MKNNKHTPGPWKAVSQGYDIGIMSKLGFQVSKIQGNKRDDFANARLIAAAPEMLGALELCCKYVAEYAEAHECLESFKFYDELAKLINKAKGEL